MHAVMSVDGETSRVMRGVQHGACDYLLKPIRMKELRNIWQHVYRKKIHDHDPALEEMLIITNPNPPSQSPCFFSDITPPTTKKRKDFLEDHKDFISSSKKPRVVWTVDLHQKFVKAVNLIGFESQSLSISFYKYFSPS